MTDFDLKIEWQENHSFLFHPERPVVSEVEPSRRVDQEKHQRALCQIAEFAGFEGEYGLSIHIVKKEKIKELNKKYRRENQVTDVLSFPLDPPRKTPKVPALMGDIFICKEKIIDQAKEHNIPRAGEFEILLIHGFLHLLGFDHEKAPKKWHDTLKALCQKKIVSYNSINYGKRKTS